MTTWTLKPEVNGQFWAEYSFEKDRIVLDEELDFDLPADKLATVASADNKPAISTANVSFTTGPVPTSRVLTRMRRQSRRNTGNPPCR